MVKKKRLTKKQIKINKKERHIKTKAYAKKQERLALKKKDKEWANSIKQLYNNKCIICGNTERLNAHHIIPREIKETRHMIDNGVALCPGCHKWKLNSAHRNPLWFLVRLESICPEKVDKLKQIVTSL